MKDSLDVFKRSEQTEKESVNMKIDQWRVTDLKNRVIE